MKRSAILFTSTSTNLFTETVQQGDDRILIFELKDVLEQSEGQTSVSFHLNVMVALCFHLLSKKLE